MQPVPNYRTSPGPKTRDRNVAFAGIKTEVLDEATRTRIARFKLGIRMNSPRFLKMFLASCRVGFYLRVLEEGEVGEGDALERTKLDPEGLSVWETCHLLYFDQKNWEGAAKALRIPALSPGWRGSFEERLAEAGVTVEYSDEPREGEQCCGP